MAHKNFNRHDLFNLEMLDDLGTVARELDDVQKFRDVHFALQNKLYGIYDGYLYSDLLDLAREADLPHDTVLKLGSLVQRIEDYIALNGETITRMNQPADYYNLGFIARLNSNSATPPPHLGIYAVEEWNRGYRDASLEYEQA